MQSALHDDGGRSLRPVVSEPPCEPESSCANVPCLQAEWTPTEPLTFKPASAGGRMATGGGITADGSSAVLAASEQHLKTT